jgi:UDP-N-acetylmuramate dehydrogenase
MIDRSPQLETLAMRKNLERTLFAQFADIVKINELLAPYTQLKVGGPAEALVQPRSLDELAAFVKECLAQDVPMRVLGSGGAILVPDEGVSGVVFRLSEPAFTSLAVEGRRVRVGAGTPLSSLISETAAHGLSGLESLVGIHGTTGGAVCCNAGDRSGEIGQHVRSVEVIDDRGKPLTRERDELRFAYRFSNIDDPIITAAELELEIDQPEAIVKRLRKTWIQRKTNQPFSFQSCCRVFRNPRGMSASVLIVQAGLASKTVGAAEVSERDANFIIANPGATSRDIMGLIELMRSQVQENCGIHLDLELAIW